MKTKPNKEHLSTYVAHTMTTLPDSLRLRKLVLATLMTILPPDFEERNEVAKMLESLHAHEHIQAKFADRLELKQRELPLAFPKHAKKGFEGDGE